jgi:Phospholipid-translocating P-type ATPase C-terminal
VTNYWTAISHISTWGSLMVFAILWFVTSLVNGADYFVFQKALSSFAFWGWLFIGVALAFLPDLIYTHVRLSYKPKDWEVLREWYHRERKNIKSGGSSFSPFEDEEGVHLTDRKLDTFQRSVDPSGVHAGGYVPPPFPSFNTHGFSSDDEGSPAAAATANATDTDLELSVDDMTAHTGGRARSGSWSSWRS